MKIVVNREQCIGSFRNKPYLIDSSIVFIKELLNDDTVVFEWGSGCSTLWFSKIVKKVYSTEGSKVWVDFVSEKANEFHLTNINLMYFNRKLSPYVLAINSIQENIDVVLIDGSERMKCLNEVLKRIDVKVIILDDSQVPKFKEASRLLSSWDRSDFVGARGKTTSVFIKPKT